MSAARLRSAIAGRRVAPSLAYACTGADDTPMLRRHWWLLWFWEELSAANSNQVWR